MKKYIVIFIFSVIHILNIDAQIITNYTPQLIDVGDISNGQTIKKTLNASLTNDLGDVLTFSLSHETDVKLAFPAFNKETDNYISIVKMKRNTGSIVDILYGEYIFKDFPFYDSDKPGVEYFLDDNYIDMWSISMRLSAGTYMFMSICADCQQYNGGYSPYSLVVESKADLSFKPLAPSSNKNYITQVIPTTETKDIIDKNNYIQFDNIAQAAISTTYYDGLGRQMQMIQHGITPNKNDLVTLQEYDQYGRDLNVWLPAVLATNSGNYMTPYNIREQAKKSNSDQKPYSTPIYEASPLNRVIKQFGPGTDWHKDYGRNSNAVHTNYYFNSGTNTENTITEIGDFEYDEKVISACERIILKPGFHFAATKDKYLHLKVDLTMCSEDNSSTTNNNSPDIKFLQCLQYKTSGSGANVSLSSSGYYKAGQLHITEIKDEDGNVVYEFKNKLGQIVLIRQMDGTISHDTYYVYDNSGNRCFVLPPRIQDEGTTQGKLDDLAYLYLYDNRNRCIGKKLPGCDWTYYVYDKADRVIFTQDGEQYNKSPKEWTFTIPDVFGRIVLTGTCTNNFDYSANPLANIVVKANYNIGRTNLSNSYTVTGVTLSAPRILSVNFYDNYDFRGMTEVPSSGTEYIAESGYGTQYTGGYKGLLTGSLTAQYQSDGTIASTYLYSVMYYDDRGRLIQTKSNTHLSGGVEKEYIAYNFTGQPTQRKHVHSATGKNTQTEVYVYTYDHAGRLLKTTHQLTDGTTVKPQVTLAENDYDELGRLKTNKKGGRTELNTTYAYNVRSWTTKISSPLFTQNLAYNTPISGVTANAQWNGNISSMSWTVQGDTERKYGFVYDNLSRLKDANYVGAGSYTTNYTYDKHGNIKTLQQYGKKEAGNAATSHGLVDNLTMDHNGNQLIWTGDTGVSVSLSESADFKDKSTTRGTIEYTYNKNGALYSDLNKGITSIQYNSLNLPQQMVINSSTVKAKNYYTYSASGVKLRTEQRYDPTLSVAPVGSTTPANDGLSNYYTNTDYVGNIIYETEKKSAALTNKTRILVDGGYIENGTYYFYLTDHLGNNRVVADASGTPIQKNHYYPFGMAFAENTTQEQGKQPYKYNGKELDQMHGLNLYDYSARYYESAIGRFTTVDPLAEKYYSISPYAYCNNNPIKFVDPDGKQIGWPINTADYQRMAVSQRVDQAIKDNSSIIQKNAVVGLLSMSDVNDATVLATAVTRGGNAINVDGSSASAVDVGFAALGAIIPAVSGSTVKSFFKGIGEALGIGGGAVKAGEKLTLRESAEIGQEAHRQIQKELRDVHGATTEVPMVLMDGTKVRKDAIMPDGTAVIIKPNTPSGVKSAEKRELLMMKNEVKTQTIYYDPNSFMWKTNSSTYIGPKNK